MLIIFGGLPGTGKTTLARELAHQLSAMHLRIDTLEQALIASGTLTDVGAAGYYAAYAVATDNLKLGLTVVADSVNPLAITRDAWVEIAKKAGVAWIEIEIICSDPLEHQRRIASRKADIPGHTLPTWQEVLDRQYDPWDCEHLIIDTATLSASQAMHTIIEAISKRKNST